MSWPSIRARSCLLAAACLWVACAARQHGARGGDAEFVLRLFEHQHPPGTVGPPSLRLHVGTPGLFSCHNFELITRLGRRGDTLVVDVGEPVAPKVCLTAFGPAQGTVTLDVPDGTYSLWLTSRGRTDYYTLILRPSAARLVAEQTTFSRARAQKETRVRSSLRYECSFARSDPRICADFTQLLQDQLLLRRQTHSSLVRYHTPVAAPVGLANNQPFTDSIQRFYAYHRADTFARARRLLRAYVAQPDRRGRSLSIVLINWNNESIWAVDGVPGVAAQVVELPAAEP